MSKEACDYLTKQINISQEKFKLNDIEILGVLTIIQSGLVTRIIKDTKNASNSFRPS